ncbi:MULTISPECIES: hypothetical protein [Methylomonas]|uniref:Cytochrome C n=2 Tax=Methylomonas TaxID=416 RepID=A0A126T7M1_9GAMM|nr:MULTISPECIES: hypothetical protein [Methylomonas]AMK78030.1 hypothetical protein JT25_016350 [Methylomonas denitrificans]OAI07672.1 hypothetical protein A1342_10290 [Methylomonas methanica]TCV85565.1 hypothetical protein EDE11_105127 [Methylomonas methanica]
MTRIIIIFILFFSAVSCSTESKHEPAAAQQSSDTRPVLAKSSKIPEPPETGEPAMHAIQNSRLQHVMQQINELVYSQLSGEINLKEQRELKTAEIARTANELASSEKSIVETLPSLNLKPDEQTTFLALADKLRVSAVHMQDLADQNQLREIPATLDTITNTCISCHVLFRKSRSLLEKCKDPRYTC